MAKTASGLKPNRFMPGKLSRWIVALGVTSISWFSYAIDGAQISPHLTPSGAERTGNKEGTIPAWQPEKQDIPGWSYGKLRQDYWKYKDDKPLYSIDASNVDKHADKLSPGQVALIKQTKGYRMDVYPTRRSCGVPDFVAENTQKNAGFAKIAENGWSVQDAYVPGYPFPMPKSGVEAMSNSMLRYRGIASEFKNTNTWVSPRKGDETWIQAVSSETIFWPWGEKGSRKLSDIGMNRASVYYTFISPAALAGQSSMVTDFLDKPGADAFYYFPGQRRVRRLPTYAYDAPQIGFENQYTMDETQVFMGPLDRFDWKLVGKKEVLVPYNAFGAYDFAGKRQDIVLRDFIEPTHRHYEMHRVWVVEATVKAGLRHLAQKRTFYLDEDSWNIVMAEDYDGQGQLWKLREGFLIPVYETGTCDVAAFVQHNLVEGRYLIDFSAAGNGTDVRWLTEAGGNSKYKSSFYTSDNLRAISER